MKSNSSVYTHIPSLLDLPATPLQPIPLKILKRANARMKLDTGSERNNSGRQIIREWYIGLRGIEGLGWEWSSSQWNTITSFPKGDPQDPSEICFVFCREKRQPEPWTGTESGISLWEMDVVFCFLKTEQPCQGCWGTVISKLNSWVMAPKPLYRLLILSSHQFKVKSLGF